MKRKHNIIITCFLLVCILSAQVVSPKTEVKAFVPAIPAGAYIVASLLIASGITVANKESLESYSNSVYNAMPSTAQDMFDVMGEYVDAQSVKAVTVGAVAMGFFNAACQTVFGISPDVYYSEGVLGSTVNNTASYTSVTVPIDLESVADIFTFGDSVVNQVYSYGGVQAQFVKASTGSTGDCYIQLTCFDGYKIRMKYNFLSSTSYYPQGFGMILPVVYASASSTPIIKFYIHGNAPGYNQPEWIEMNKNQSTNTEYWNETTQLWVDFGSMNLYNTIMLHMEGYNSPAAVVDQTKYNETVNAETPVDTTVKASQDLTTIAQNTASTITAIDGVSTGVDNMSSALQRAIAAAAATISSAYTTVLNGINTAINTMSTTLTSAMEGVTTAINSLIDSLYNAIVSALSYVFVPTLTLTSISDVIIGKLNLGFVPQTSFASQPIAVDIPMGTYSQHMVLDNSLWTQFRSYMVGFVYFSFAWLFYKKVVSIGGND